MLMQMQLRGRVGDRDTIVSNREPFVIAGSYDSRGIAMVVKRDFRDRSGALELEELLPDRVA